MKKLIFIIMYCFQFSFVVFSQNTFAPLGAKWVYTEPKILNLFEGPKYFEITDLDTIQGKVCSRITYDTSFMGDVTHFYQDNEKIYFRVKNSEIDTFLLFFDQSAKENDTLDIGVRNAPYFDYIINDTIVYYSMKVKIDSIKTEEVDNKSIRVWYLWAVSNFTPYTCHEIGLKYYENVGYEYIFLPYFGCLDPSIEYNLRCYEDPGISFKFVDYPCDYHSETSDIENNNNVVLSPNPSGSIINLSLPSGFMAEQIYISDIFGKRVLNLNQKDEDIYISHLEAGLYFVIVRDRAGRMLKSKFVKI